MANKKRKKVKKTEKEPTKVVYERKPWIEFKTGVVIIAICSIVMVVLTAYQTIPYRGVVGGILWGLFFGALIWGVFGLFLLYNKWMKRFQE